MTDNRQKRLIIRLSRGRLSFATTDGSEVLFEEYPLNSSISMAANLREALRTMPLLSDDFERVLVMVDAPTLMVPANLFIEEESEALYHHAFTGDEQLQVMHTVLPDLNAVALFAIQKDLRSVIANHFGDVSYSAAVAPVWRHLHQRSFPLLSTILTMHSTTCWQVGNNCRWRQSTTRCIWWATSMSASS